MKFYLVAFFLCVCISSISSLKVFHASNDGLFDELKLKQINQETARELDVYATAYFKFLSNQTQSTMKDLDEILGGIIYVFTVKITEGEKKVLKVIGQDGAPITTQLPVKIPETDVAYNENCPPTMAFLGVQLWKGALSTGKDYIRNTLNQEPAVKTYLGNNTGSAGYNYFEFHTSKDRSGYDHYMMFTVFYSRYLL